MDSAKNLHESKHAFSPRAFRKESTLLHLSFSLIETYFELTSRIIRLKKCFCCFKLLCVLSFFSGVWLCSPINCSLPGSSVHGILQARILEWAVMPSSRTTLNYIKDIHIGKEDIKLSLLADVILYNFNDLRTSTCKTLIQWGQ